MTWNGNWTGSDGSQTIQATDSATWLFDSGSNSYTSMTFQQDASLLPPGEIASSSLLGWLVVGTEVLGTVAGGVLSGGWGAAAAGAGLVLASVTILNPPTPTPPPTPPLPPVVPVPPLPPGSGYQEVWTYDGTTGSQTKTQTITPPANNNQLQTGGTINCNPTINVCNSSNVSIVVSTPESSNVLGILGMMGLGLFLSRHKIKN